MPEITKAYSPVLETERYRKSLATTPGSTFPDEGGYPTHPKDQMPQTNLPDGFNARDIQRISSFVCASRGIPQLIHARVHAITMIWNMVKGGVEISNLPELEADEVQVFLRTSDRFLDDSLDQGYISEAA